MLTNILGTGFLVILGTGLVWAAVATPPPAVAESRDHESHDPGHHHHDGRHYPDASPLSKAPSANLLATNQLLALPPLPEGVEELRFADFFKPVASRGLEFTDKVKALEGKRVRLLGYMVRSDKSYPGLFMFSPVPVQCHEAEMGLADDLPATLVHASTTTDSEKHVPHTPGLLLLTGTLSLGPKEEKDGRISNVRLRLDFRQTPHQTLETISTNAAPTSQANAASVAPQTIK